MRFSYSKRESHHLNQPWTRKKEQEFKNLCVCVLGWVFDSINQNNETYKNLERNSLLFCFVFVKRVSKAYTQDVQAINSGSSKRKGREAGNE